MTRTPRTPVPADAGWSLDPTAVAKYPPLLTPRQAADLLQVPLLTVYDWSSRGVFDRGGAKRTVGRHLRLVRDRLLACFPGGAGHGR